MCFDQKEMPSPSVSLNNIYIFKLPRTMSTGTPEKNLYFIQAHSYCGHYELVNPIDCENQVLAWRMLAKKILLQLGTLAHTKSYGLPN